MKQLGDCYPQGFFKILSSKNINVYGRAILLLFREVSRNPVVEEDNFLERLAEKIGNDRIEMDEDEGFDSDTDETEARKKARYIYNKMKKYGWIRPEVNARDFKTVLYLPPEAFPIMEALCNTMEEKTQEYGSLVYRSYIALHHAVNDPAEQENIFDAVLSSAQASAQLKLNLNKFSHSLHSFKQEAEDSQNTREILDALLDDFREEARIGYEPVKTVDSYTRYKGPIRDAANAILFDPTLLDMAVDRAEKSRRYADRNEARREILFMLDEILETYEHLNDTMRMIENEYQEYLRRVEKKVRYLQRTDRTVIGDLTSILSAYGRMDGEAREQMMDLMEKSTLPAPVDPIGGKQLYQNPPSRAQILPPSRLAAAETGRDEATERIRQDIQRRKKEKERVKKYLAAITEREGKTVSMKDIPIQNRSDFEKVYEAFLMAQSGKNGFEITDIQDGEKIQKGDFIVPSLSFRRKE